MFLCRNTSFLILLIVQENKFNWYTTYEFVLYLKYVHFQKKGCFLRQKNKKYWCIKINHVWDSSVKSLFFPVLFRLLSSDRYVFLNVELTNVPSKNTKGYTKLTKLQKRYIYYQTLYIKVIYTTLMAPVYNHLILSRALYHHMTSSN